MKKKHSFHFWTPRSLVFRLCALFLCALIPLDGLGFLLFRSGSNTVSRQIRNESRSALRYISESVEASVETLLWDLYELESNMELRRLASSGGTLERYKFYQSVESVRDYVDILAKNNPWMEYITVYLPASSIYISSQHVQKTTYVVGQYGEYEAGEFETLIAQARAHGANDMLYDGSGFSLVLLYPSRCYYQDRTPSYVAQLRVNVAAIRSFLASRKSFERQLTAFVDHETVTIVLDEGSEANAPLVEACWATLRERMPQENEISGSFEMNGEPYIVTACYSDALNATFLQLVPSDVALRPLRFYRLGLAAYIVVSLALFCLCAMLSLRMVRKPIVKLMDAYGKIEAGDYAACVDGGEKIEEFAYLANGFNSMAAKLNDTVNRLYKQEIYAQRMELSQLQMQINPHFLFNSYFMMDRLLQQGDYETASELSNHLGEFFMYINRDGRRYVELSAEWEHMHSYAMVQLLRYNRRLRLEIEPVPDAFRAYIVPRLILQPIMENSIEHGLAHTRQNGLSSLRFEWDERFLRIVVEDNGGDVTDELIETLSGRIRRYDAPGQETTALINIHRRLQLFYGGEYGLRFSRSALGGLKTEILLPAEGKEEPLADPERADC